jgi:putative transposase
MDVYRRHANAHSVGWSTWHLEWCTKYRYKIFVTPKLRQLCLIAIHEAAKRHRIGILDAECDREHVHVIIALPLTTPPTKAAMLLKGISAKIIMHEAPQVRRLYRGKCLWSPGKFMASVGYITLEKAKQYLEAHHAKKCHLLKRNPRPDAKRRGRPQQRASL